MADPRTSDIDWICSCTALGGAGFVGLAHWGISLGVAPQWLPTFQLLLWSLTIGFQVMADEVSS